MAAIPIQNLSFSGTLDPFLVPGPVLRPASPLAAPPPTASPPTFADTLRSQGKSHGSKPTVAERPSKPDGTDPSSAPPTSPSNEDSQTPAEPSDGALESESSNQTDQAAEDTEPGLDKTADDPLAQAVAQVLNSITEQIPVPTETAPGEGQIAVAPVEVQEIQNALKVDEAGPILSTVADDAGEDSSRERNRTPRLNNLQAATTAARNRHDSKRETDAPPQDVETISESTDLRVQLEPEQNVSVLEPDARKPKEGGGASDQILPVAPATNESPLASELAGLSELSQDSERHSDKRRDTPDSWSAQRGVEQTPVSETTQQGQDATLFRLSQQLVGRPSSTESGRPTLSGPDQARFVERVARALQVADGRGGQLRLRLHPPELGAIKLEVQVRAGVMMARVEAENAVARTLLLDSLPVLRERLAEQGVRVERFDVGLMNGQGGQQQSNYRDEQEIRQSFNPFDGRRNVGVQGDVSARAVATPSVGHAGQLNVIV